MTRTLVDALRERAQAEPDRTALTFLTDGEHDEAPITYGQLDRRARAIGAALAQAGAAGERVILLYPPGLEFLCGYWGCLYAGAVPVPTYPPDPTRLGRTLPRVQAIAGDAKATFALTMKPLLDMAEFVLAQAPDLRALKWMASDALEAGLEDSWRAPAADENAIALLQYTSGSTGSPKGVMVTHRNLLANGAAGLECFEFSRESVSISWLPTYHDMGFMVGVMHPVLGGFHVVQMAPTAFLQRPLRWLAALSRFHGTHAGGPNFAYDLCARKVGPEARATLDLSAWQCAFNGAEPVRRETLERFARTFAECGFRATSFRPCYGLAEATLMVSGGRRAALPVVRAVEKSALESHRVKSDPGPDGVVLVSSGPAVAETTIVIADPATGEVLPPGRVGEIWVNAPGVAAGYWNRPEDSERTFRARVGDRPFLRTGDLGFLDEGELFVTGRAKDLIIIRGTNHYPQDIELSVERSHPALRAGCGAAFSIDVEGEERLVLVQEVERRYRVEDRRKRDREGDRRKEEAQPPLPAEQAEPLEADEVFFQVRETITQKHEIVPYAIVLIRAGSIAKTSSGKIQRQATRAAFLAGTLDAVAEWRERATVPPPTTTAAAARTPEEPLPGKPSPVARTDDRPAVLVVDDEVANLEFLVRALRRHFLVAAVDDGAKALTILKTGRFAVIITDQRMPGMSGVELLIKARELVPETVRIMLTAYDDAERQREAINQAHVHSYLYKPISAATLVAAVDDAVATYERNQRSQRVAAIEGWLVSWLSHKLKINPHNIDVRQPMARYGLDSVAAVEIMADLGDWLEQEVPDSLIRSNQTIEGVARSLAGAAPAAVEASAPEPRTRESESVAIIGLSCRFPGAPDPESFWRLLAEGRDAITEVPPERWDREALYDADPAAPGRMNSRFGGFLDGIADFDPSFFGISPREAARIDPQHRLLLEVAWEALERAGQAPDRLSGARVGVFVGLSAGDWPRLLLADRERIDAYAQAGATPALAANRLSYLLDVRGPSVAVDAAGASSLVALHLACASLRAGECQMAIVGGANLVLSPEPGIAMAKARLLAPDGRCKPFDASADGTVRAEGCGVVILKPLSEALAARDRILAVVRGSAVTQNGRGASLSAQSGPAQEAALRQALETARVAPAEIGYVEAHGAGLAVQDAVEIKALQAVLAPGRSPEQTCLCGSVKTNIGDLEAAAGIAGLIKVVLALEHGLIPAHLHLRRLSPRIGLDGALSIAAAARPWPAGTARRYAGVSSFGSGGTNAHVVVEEAPAAPPVAPQTGSERPLHVLALSARSDKALRALAGRLAEKLDGQPLGDVCFTLNTGRAHFAHRLTILAAETAELRDRLRAFSGGAAAMSGQVLTKNRPKVAFLLAGGGLRPHLARRLYDHHPRFRSRIHQCDEIVRKLAGTSILDFLYPTGPAALGDRDPRTGPALFAVEYALAELWQTWGVHPDAVLGVGTGEVAALCVAGVLGLDDALELVLAHGKGPDAVEPLLQKLELGRPWMPIASTLSGKMMRENNPPDAAYLRRQVTETARPADALRLLSKEGFEVLVEIGPGAELLALGRETVRKETGCWRASLDPARDDWQQMLETLASLYLRGVGINWAGFDKDVPRRRLELPTYPFERQRFWIDR